MTEEKEVMYGGGFAPGRATLKRTWDADYAEELRVENEILKAKMKCRDRADSFGVVVSLIVLSALLMYAVYQGITKGWF